LGRTDRTKIEREIKTMHKEIMASSSSTNSNSPDIVFFKKTKHQSKPSLLEGFLLSVGKRQSRVNKDDSSLSIVKELSIYRSLAMQEFNDVVEHSKPHDPLLFWNLHGQQLKFLSSLARKHLIVPSTSVPSEATFSVASYLGRKERNRLTPENLCMLVFLKDKINDDMSS
jgi:hypothetical protein